MEKYKYGVNGTLSKAERLLTELDNEEILKYGSVLERNFKVNDKVTLRDSRLYTGNFDTELRRLADTKEQVYIKKINTNDDRSIWSYDIITQYGRIFDGFYPSEFDVSTTLTGLLK